MDPQALVQAIQADPQLGQMSLADQQAFALALTSQASPQQKFGQLEAIAKKYPGYKPEGFFQNPAVKAALIGVGGAIAAPLIAGALGGGAAPAVATGSGVGIGETGATVGLSGPIAGMATTGGPSAAGGIFGALSKYAGPIGDVGSVLSKAAAGSAAGRREDAATTGRAIAENNAAKAQAAKFNLDLPSVRTNQVARGEVLNTMHNAPPTGDPRIDKFGGGGLRPDAFGPQARAAGSELSRQAMSGLMNPAQDRLVPQEIPGTKPSTLEQLGAGVGLGADIFSLLAKYGGSNGAR